MQGRYFHSYITQSTEPHLAVVLNVAKRFAGASLPQQLLGRKLTAFFMLTEGQHSDPASLTERFVCKPDHSRS